MDTMHDDVDERLRRSRQRYTRGRRHLVELLAAARGPLTVLELQEAGQSQSVSSLYRNLAVLDQCDVVRRIASTDLVVRYELAEDFTRHHHHLVCESCGRVDDLILPEEAEAAFTRAAEEARRQHGFEVNAHRFDLVGTCVSCLADHERVAT